VEGTLVNEVANLEANKSLKRKRAFDEEVPEAGKKRKILPLKTKVLAKATVLAKESKAKQSTLKKVTRARKKAWKELNKARVAAGLEKEEESVVAPPATVQLAISKSEQQIRTDEVTQYLSANTLFAKIPMTKKVPSPIEALSSGLVALKIDPDTIEQVST